MFAVSVFLIYNRYKSGYVAKRDGSLLNFFSCLYPLSPHPRQPPALPLISPGGLTFKMMILIILTLNILLVCLSRRVGKIRVFSQIPLGDDFMREPLLNIWRKTAGDEESEGELSEEDEDSFSSGGSNGSNEIRASRFGRGNKNVGRARGR